MASSTSTIMRCRACSTLRPLPLPASRLSPSTIQRCMSSTTRRTSQQSLPRPQTHTFANKQRQQVSQWRGAATATAAATPPAPAAEPTPSSPPTAAADATPAAPAAAASVDVSPKISAIVDQISTLNLLETADLVTHLKHVLKIPDMAMSFGGGGGGAPGGAAAAGAPAAAAAEEDDAGAAGGEGAGARAKSLFTLHLKSFDAGSKPKVIKEIKALLGLSLVESKKFVEAAPKQMRENVSKEEGEKIVETLKAVGGVVAME